MCGIIILTTMRYEMNISELLKNNKLDTDDIEYAVKLTSKKYFDKCLKDNEIKKSGLLKELILKGTFDKLNIICVMSKISTKETSEYISIAIKIIDEEFKKLFNQIESNLKSGTEML